MAEKQIEKEKAKYNDKHSDRMRFTVTEINPDKEIERNRQRE